MGLKTFRPVTPGLRQLITVSRKELYSGAPVKKLTVGKSSSGGRNNLGRISVRHRGGGHKRKYRFVDFKRNKVGISASVKRLEYDPNRTAFIALIEYKDGELSYIIAPRGIKAGDVVASGDGLEAEVGNAMPLEALPMGTIVHNVEMKPGKGGQLARAAGCYCQYVGKEGAYAILKMCSGEQRRVLARCFATVGAVSNQDQSNINLGKAGRSRWLGRRSSVRGVVMNPVDHPHGGGEGKTSGGRHPVSPWGISTKGKRTRRNKSTGKFIIRDRRAKRSRK